MIDDFHNWGAWSPWEKLDPAMKKTYSGAAAGKGAVYDWTGNSKVGAGRMEILDASPAKTTIKLDFLKPFEAHNIADFTLEPAGDSTNVTWAMRGASPFLMRVMGDLPQHGQGDRKGFRDRPREPEDGLRTLSGARSSPRPAPAILLDMSWPQDPIAAVTHPDPYPYYADLVARRPLYRDDALQLWVASSAAAVTAVLASDLCRVRPPAEPVPGRSSGRPPASSSAISCG